MVAACAQQPILCSYLVDLAFSMWRVQQVQQRATAPSLYHEVITFGSGDVAINIASDDVQIGRVKAYLKSPGRREGFGENHPTSSRSPRFGPWVRFGVCFAHLRLALARLVTKAFRSVDVPTNAGWVPPSCSKALTRANRVNSFAALVSIVSIEERLVSDGGS